MTDDRRTSLPQAHRAHGRHWRDNAYCYPVVSRRSGGLSIGINLNPDKACNFDCVYCQVDRSQPAAIRKVDLERLRSELDGLVTLAGRGDLFAEAPFDAVPPDQRVIRDMAFSGDGEPTTFREFDAAVAMAADIRRAHGLTATKLVLITDACYLTKPHVRRGLALLDENNGEVWAKLDAGTEGYYQTVNRPNYPLSHVLENILDAARARPLVIQSLWMRLAGAPPPRKEIEAFAARLAAIIEAGGRIKLVQVYTIARRPAESFAAALTRSELDAVADVIAGRLPVPIERHYGG